MPGTEDPIQQPPAGPDVDDMIRRGDRVEFRAYLRIATPRQAMMAWIKASGARIPDMADAAEKRMRGEPEETRMQREDGPCP